MSLKNEHKAKSWKIWGVECFTPPEQLPLYVERETAYNCSPCWFAIIYLIPLFFSGEVKRISILIFAPLTDVPKEVPEDSREFPEQSSQILKKSEYIIYQHT